MTIVIVLQVILRYFLNSPLSWAEELTVYLMLWMSYLCLPYLIYSNKNVSMSLLSNRFNGTKIEYVLEIIYLLFIIFTGFVWYPFAIKGVQNGLLIELTQLPVNFGIVHSIIPVSLTLMLTIAFQRLLYSLYHLFGKPAELEIFVDPLNSTQE
ncbi:MAG: TRAP transporter small permease [Bacteroidales bacterium]